MPHILAECGALKCEGPEGTPRERRANGVCQKPISIYTAHGEYGGIISANSLTQLLWAIWGNILLAGG